MVEVPPGLAIASPFLAMFGIFLTIRFGVIDGRIEKLITRTKSLASDALNRLEGQMRRKKKPDPQISANFASEYCGLTQRVTELTKYDALNWSMVGLDVLGLILCLVYSFIPTSTGWESIGIAIFTALLLVFLCCMFFFGHSMAYVRKMKDRLDKAEANHQS